MTGPPHSRFLRLLACSPARLLARSPARPLACSPARPPSLTFPPGPRFILPHASPCPVAGHPAAPRLPRNPEARPRIRRQFGVSLPREPSWIRTEDPGDRGAPPDGGVAGLAAPAAGRQ